MKVKCVYCGEDLQSTFSTIEGVDTISIHVWRCQCKDKTCGIGDRIIEEQDFKLLKDIVEKIGSDI